MSALDLPPGGFIGEQRTIGRALFRWMGAGWVWVP